MKDSKCQDYFEYPINPGDYVLIKRLTKMFSQDLILCRVTSATSDIGVTCVDDKSKLIYFRSPKDVLVVNHFLTDSEPYDFGQPSGDRDYFGAELNDGDWVLRPYEMKSSHRHFFCTRYEYPSSCPINSLVRLDSLPIFTFYRLKYF